MQYIIKGYEPKRLFEYFEEISAIPRPSGQEGQIADYLVRFAKEKGLWHYRDKIHNVIIKKPGSPGCENLPAVMLQGHTDMVCEKNAGVSHDFFKEGIKLSAGNGKLWAKGTTLGADNGVAVALMLTILEDDNFPHPPLECVFTVQEETGLTGALEIDGTQLSARTMINLDSEEEGVATVSCAGGMRITLSRKVSYQTSSLPGLQISLRGLKGGHSGMDIALSRGNANKLMGRILYLLYQEIPFGLCEVNGGNKDNAIPRESDAFLAFSNEGDRDRTILLLQKTAEELFREYGGTDPDFRVEALPFRPKRVMDVSSSESLIRLLYLAPDGVRKWSPESGGFTVSSLNMGVVHTGEEGVSIVFSPRSSVASLQRDTREYLLLLAELLGFGVEVRSEYPGWRYQPQSTIRDICKKCYGELTGKELRCEAIHAGLECGIFSEKLPGLDAIAIGPEIVGCHTPEETLSLESLSLTYRLVREMLQKLTKK